MAISDPRFEPLFAGIRYQNPGNTHHIKSNFCQHFDKMQIAAVPAYMQGILKELLTPSQRYLNLCKCGKIFPKR